MVVEKLQTLLERGEISADTYENLERWLSMGRDEKELETLLQEEKLEEIRDAFSQTIPFGTGGRRGLMGIGPNRINNYTIMDSAQGVINYLRKVTPQEELSAVVAYDTRHGSRELAETAARVFSANGAKTYLYPTYRSTPQLSFSVRYLKTSVGVMISASHNPPSDNGIKVYWNDGAQVVSPHDNGIIKEVESVRETQSITLEEGLEDGRISYLDEEIDEAYLDLLLSQPIYPERDVEIVFSPLHGVGLTNACEALERAGFKALHKVEQQCEPDGDFPHVARHIPNPEVPSAMEESIKLGKEKQADLVLATDPDADRLGVAVRANKSWKLLTGNQIGALIIYHLLSTRKEKGELSPKDVVIRTLPTSGLISAIARAFGVTVIDHLLVGFKYIAYEIEHFSQEENFLFGTEESHGYLIGSAVRDKDGAMAALAIAEIAAHLKAKGLNIMDSLEEIYQEFGYFKNLLHSLILPGLEGREAVRKIMGSLRQNPPTYMGPLKVVGWEDHLTLKKKSGDTITDLPYLFTGDMLVFHLEDPEDPLVSQFVLRPSGTEPKIKFYFQVNCPAPQEDFEIFQRKIDEKVEGWLKEILAEILVE